MSESGGDWPSAVVRTASLCMLKMASLREYDSGRTARAFAVETSNWGMMQMHLISDDQGNLV